METVFIAIIVVLGGIGALVIGIPMLIMILVLWPFAVPIGLACIAGFPGFLVGVGAVAVGHALGIPSCLNS
jgi:hypothetical protein